MSENERLRVMQFLHALDDATCERLERFPGGVATLSDAELPRVLNMNLLRVESLADRLSLRELTLEAERIAGDAEKLQRRLPFRRVVAYDEEIGARLALGFEQLERWQAERVVLMAQHHRPEYDVRRLNHIEDLLVYVQHGYLATAAAGRPVERDPQFPSDVRSPPGKFIRY